MKIPNKEFYNSEAKIKDYGITTFEDEYLREKEISSIINEIENTHNFESNMKILDVGAGDGYSTAKFKKALPKAKITAIDYSEEMVKKSNGVVHHADILDEVATKEYYDFIITERCLINLEPKKQLMAIKNIHQMLKTGGTFLMCESSKSNYSRLNKIRKKYGLTKLKSHEQNHYIDDSLIKTVRKDMFELEYINFFSDVYYWGSRVIYPMLDDKPDHHHDVNKLFAKLPLLNEDLKCGRENIWVLIKK